MKEPEVKQLLKDNNISWEDFIKWMHGQTMGLNKDGTPDYYEWDVKRFINLKRGQPTYWD